MFVVSAAKEYELEVIYDKTWPQNDGLFYGNGLSVISHLKVSSTSVPTFENSGIVIYPNPAKDELFIKLNEAHHEQVQIVNSLGVVVIDEFLDSKIYRMDVEKLHAGIYFVIIKDLQNQYIEKVIIQN